MSYDLSYADVEGMPPDARARRAKWLYGLPVVRDDKRASGSFGPPRLEVEVRPKKRRAKKGKRAECWPSRRLLKVADRDGWRCHLCGLEVPRGARKWSLPWAPSLDHIVPRVEGGSDALRNVKLAHGYCNSRRGDRPVEECEPSMFSRLKLPEVS